MTVLYSYRAIDLTVCTNFRSYSCEGNHPKHARRAVRSVLCFALTVPDLTVNRTDQIERVLEIKFNDVDGNCEMHSDKQDHSGCENLAFIRCSHCGRKLCLLHFLQRHCFHNAQAGILPGPQLGPSAARTDPPQTPGESG